MTPRKSIACFVFRAAEEESVTKRTRQDKLAASPLPPSS
jgi:hypothetical protein